MFSGRFLEDDRDILPSEAESYGYCHSVFGEYARTGDCLTGCGGNHRRLRLALGFHHARLSRFFDCPGDLALYQGQAFRAPAYG